MIGMHIVDARGTRARTHKPNRIRHRHSFQRARHFHVMILARGHAKRAEPEPPGTGLLLVHQNIGRAARMLNGVGYRLRSRRAFRPFRINVTVPVVLSVGV